MPENGEIILYQTEDGGTEIEVHLADNNVWLTQTQMAGLFQKSASTINEHIKNIYNDGELSESETLRKFGNSEFSKPTNFYNLDMIISVGYRVNSHRGIQFRIWATKALREYMVKGFVIDDDRLSGSKSNYFEELHERVRKIRTSEANFYDKAKGIFATSIDYDSKADISVKFFQTLQNKFHYAITGQTAAELIVNRVSAAKPKMGLVHTKGKNATHQEAKIAKNYYEELELKRLELLVDQFLSYAELQSVEQHPMYMKDWVKRLDDFIRFNDKKVLTNAGTVSHQHAMEVVDDEFEIYKHDVLESGEYTKDDFEDAIDKGARQIAPKANGGKK